MGSVTVDTYRGVGGSNLSPALCVCVKFASSSSSSPGRPVSIFSPKTCGVGLIGVLKLALVVPKQLEWYRGMDEWMDG